MDRQEVKKIDCKQGEILLGSLLVYKVVDDEGDAGYEYCIIDLCEDKPYTKLGYEYTEQGLNERVADFRRRYVGDVEFKETA